VIFCGLIVRNALIPRKPTSSAINLSLCLFYTLRSPCPRKRLSFFQHRDSIRLRIAVLVLVGTCAGALPLLSERQKRRASERGSTCCVPKTHNRGQARGRDRAPAQKSARQSSTMLRLVCSAG